MGKILQISKNDLVVKFNTEKPEGSLERSLDISKAKKLLGFKPRWTLEEGLRITIEWFKEQNL